jgi:outer membrane usher protein FimD/PapC
MLLRLVAVSTLVFSVSATGAGKVPPGFEALLTKQRTMLDVFFAEEFLVSTLADFNTNEVEFTVPPEVATRIPGVIDREAILAALSGPLNANAELRCYSRGQQNCGILEPEVAGIIFDEDRFRIDVFVNREYLALQSVPRESFLPRSNAGWSFLQNFSNAFAGDDSDSFEAYSLNAASMVAKDETRFLMTTNYSNISDWTADDILVRRDFQGREYQMGYFRTTNDASLRFIPEVSLRGVRAASTLDTRTDLNEASGRDLSIFLVNRSRVSLFKDGRLVSSANYNAGNQVIDTSRLPNGAYPLIIRIEDGSGRTREEQRFYIKSSRFPPVDQTLWGVEMGEQVLLNSQDFIPEAEGVFFGRFNLAKRLTDSLAVNGGLAARDTDGIVELGIDHLHRYYELRLNAATSNDNGYGFSADGRTRWREFMLYGNYRETWTDNELRDGFESGESTDDEEQLLASGLTWFGEDSRQWSTSLNWYVAGGTLTANARNTRLTGQPNIKEYSVAYRFPVIRAGRHRLEIDFEASEFNDLKQVLFSLHYRWDRGNFSHSLGSQYQYRELDGGDDDQDLEYQAGTSWRDKSPEAQDLSFHANASHRADFDDATAGMQWRGRYGELRGEVRHERQEDFNRSSYAGTYYSSFAWSEGGVALGGDQQSRSAIMIELIGELSDDVYFDVIVNGARRGWAKPGSRNLITVLPFETYLVELTPRGQGFVSFDGRQEKVTLYPGNVATLTWDVSPVNIIFGRLLDQSGAPVKNAVLRGASGLAMTDENGFFQAELQASVKSLHAETWEFECQVMLPEYEVNNSIALLGELSCELEQK